MATRAAEIDDFLAGAARPPLLARDFETTGMDMVAVASRVSICVHVGVFMTDTRLASPCFGTAAAIPLTAYSGNDFKDAGISNVQALASIDPSVNVTSSTGAAYAAVRGIASTDVTEIGDPSVPITRDGFYTNCSFSIQFSMYDIARVEVLKRPQGTLNGRNSTGGLVSIITNRPTKESGGFGSVEVGNYGMFNGELGRHILFGQSGLWLLN